MSFESEIISLLKGGDKGKLEYSAILPPSQAIAQYIAAFANTDGGALILGIKGPKTAPVVQGIPSDFNVTPITRKAIDLLSVTPVLAYGYVSFSGKQLFAISVEKSTQEVAVDGKVYQYLNGKVVDIHPEIFQLRTDSYPLIKQLSLQIESYKQKATRSGTAIINHYLGVLKIMDNLQGVLFPAGSAQITTIPEGKILSKILFSTLVDNFEVYLGDLLYEISLAKPETMKSGQTVTIEEVLNCADIEEFVKFVASKKVNKFQKGSVKDFIKDNPPISALNILTPTVQIDVENILQIRHLYTHRNGIVDEKFLLYYPVSLPIGTEFLLTVEDVLEKLKYLIDISYQLDQAAIIKYSLV
jgi:hypothetical protein